MIEFFARLFQSDFMPHGHCFLWKPEILWLHVGSDLMIALAYYSIPLALVTFVRRREDLAFNWMFVLFASFIFACGTTHLFDIWTTWYGTYRVEGIVKVFTALVSVTTAVLLWPLVPKAVALPSPTQLRREIEQRRETELQLQQAKDELEDRVAARTEELRQANLKLEEQRRELSRSNSELESFAYLASHDLQEPLRQVSSFCTLLKERYGAALDDDGRQFVDFAVAGADRMSELIRDLLAYSRVQSSEAHATELLDLEHLVRSVVADMMVTINEAGVEVHFESLPTVRAHQARLAQLFGNLLSNAVKYRRTDGPQVIFGSRQGPDGLEFFVRDNGIGFDPKYKDRIFEIFQRLHSRARYPGTGIGLAICKRIVESYGGSIWAESSSGGGATFYFTIPHCESDHTARLEGEDEPVL
ncbi:MAG: hypothetical protein KDD69_16885 [Bdellovibrionales bacterium]|nr:hypothetical protein [Bdellovibrionales bacterium]